MSHSIFLLHRGRRRGACVALLLAVLGSPGASAGGTDATSPVDPGTVIARDGSTYPAAPISALESRPFAGTGVLPEGAPAAYAPPEVGVRPMEAFASESVIGTDERRRVTDTTVYPYRAIASLVITFPLSGGWICTGFFIDADTLATAGHCLYSHTEGGWATSIAVYPGRNGDELPYGSAWATNIYTVTGWINGQDHRYDYGAIKIASPLGNTTGWLGYGAKIDQNLVKVNIRIFGYPADKPTGEMWGTRRRIKGVATEKLFYKIDTFGGQSGSPIYGRVSNVCQPCAFGIHAYGTGIEPFGDSNSGTRVTSTVFANLAYWASQ